jgi:dolichyl-diphosphooligosaccharide--protein glycosyltransferase
LVLLAFVSSLTLRSAFSYHTVFRAGEVVIQDPDAAFHVRTIQNLVRHFPYRSGSDPYSGFPRGQNIDTGSFHDYAIGTVAWVAGLGAPSRHLTDVIAAWFPALLGALMVIPVYFLGRNLFSPAAGLIASGLIAILPGTFLWVTRLGNPDHHASEALLSTLLLLLMVKALQATSPWRLVALGGLVLGSYLATQAAGAFLVVFVEIWAILQICSNHLRGQSSRLVWIVTVPPLLIAWPIFFLAGPTLWSNIVSLVLFCGVVSISGAVALSEVLHSRLRFFLALLVGLLSAATAFLFLKPQLAKAAIAIVTDRGSEAAQTVGELRPLLTSMGSFSLVPAWAQFTTCWLLAPIALAYIGWRAIKTNSPSHLLFTVWSALMMVASFQYTRNCYYLAPCMALLSGFACTHFLRLERRYERIVAGLLVGAALIVPNASLAYPFVSTDTGLSEDWRSALAFLRHETPEPFGDPTAFDRYFPRLVEGGLFPYPKSAYGILNWWDFGHWISAYGRRIPIANGMQTGAAEAARFFTATDPTQGDGILRQNGARYVIADSSLPIGANQRSGSFAAMTRWAGLKDDQFWEEYVGAAPGGEVSSFPVFYPAYYQSMVARLYLFDGQPQTPAGSTWVIQYSGETERGQKRKRLQWSQRFGTYEEASRYVREHPSLNLVIGGLNPLQSCVPIPKLDRYRLLYSSQPLQGPVGEPVRSVKIFEFAP